MNPIIAIIGSRGYPDFGFLGEQVRRLHHTTCSVISGGARGVDKRAVEFAKRFNVPTEEFPADWSQGKGAGFARNQVMAERCTGCWAFWDGVSRGTLDMVKRVRALGKPVVLWGPNRERLDPDSPKSQLERCKVNA